MVAPLAFVDTETTGLDPYQHEIWEVGLIIRDGDGNEFERLWHLPVNLTCADQMALNIGRYHERYNTSPAETIDVFTFRQWAAEFVQLTRGAHLVGAVVSFDAERLHSLLRRLGQCPMWHYHLVDIEALAVGFLAGLDSNHLHSARPEPFSVAPPWKSDQLTEALGIHVDDMDKHTALGDARWAKAIYDKVMATR